MLSKWAYPQTVFPRGTVMITIKFSDSKFDTPRGPESGTHIDTSTTATHQKGQPFQVVLMPPQDWPDTSDSDWA